MRFTTLASSLFLLITLSLHTLPARAAIDGVWQLHPSADILSHTADTISHLNCVQILDGERYTYFRVLAQARWNNGGFPDYDATHTSLLRYDKHGGPDATLRPLAYTVPLGGADVETATYSYEGKYLAVAYKNGTVDILHDDGRRASCTAISSYNRPADKEIHSITCHLDGSTLTVATGFGYVVIDAATGEALTLCDIHAPLLFAGMVGDRMVVYDESTAYTVPAGTLPASRDSLVPLAVDPAFTVPAALSGAVSADRTLKSPELLFPLTDNTFLYITPSDGTGTSMIAVTLAGGKGDGEGDGSGATVVRGMLQASSLRLNYTSYSVAPNYRNKFYNEGLIERTRDGVYNPGNGTPFLIRKGVEPDYTAADPGADFIARAKVTCPSFSSVAPSRYAPSRTMYLRSATADGVNFWFFYPREGFRRALLSGGSYAMEGEMLLPDACACFVADAMAWHPDYGMMMRQHGAAALFGSTLSCQSDGLCAYRGGSWTTLSLFRESKLRGTHMRARNGIAFDPAHPAYIWSGSGSNGFYRQNLDNPCDVLHMGARGRDAGPGRNDPWYVPVYTSSGTYWDSASYGCPKFDTDGTMWVSHGNYGMAEEGTPVTELWYWTAEDRAKCDRVATDHSLYDTAPMGLINVPSRGFSPFTEVCPMSHPANAGLIGIVPDQNQAAVLYDHNGTPGDTSDDRMACLENIYDENMLPLDLVWPSYMFEDPYDGAILVAYNMGMLVTSRADLFAEKKRGRMLRPATEAMGGVPCDTPCTRVTAVTVDDMGRKWLATADDGIYCLSEDRSAILAHYDTDTSDIPSDVCYTACWNPETRSIWTGTAEGVAEFIPSGSEGTVCRTPAPKVSPVIVSPEYRGYVTISNLTDGRTYRIAAAGSAEYVEATPTEGSVQLDGSTLPPGEYTVSDAAGTAATFIRL